MRGPGGWVTWIGQAPGKDLQTTFASGFYTNMITSKEPLDLKSISVEAAVKLADEQQGQTFNAVDPNLKAFMARGGKLIVYLDHKAELTGFDRIWRSISGVRAPVKALRDPKLAEEDLLRYWKGHDADRIEVHGIRFGYFELGYNEKQTVLQPAYVSIVTLVSGDAKQPIRMKTVHVTPAATNAPGDPFSSQPT